MHIKKKILKKKEKKITVLFWDYRRQTSSTDPYIL